ncbi:MAG: amidase [Chloroflexi bacterium]|nr:amidase [Chloroflexota bacterium]
MPELDWLTASELARLLHAQKISSVELTMHFLDRLEKFGPRYHALAELTRDLARQQARRADHTLRRVGAKHASLLLGIPYGAKDLLATKNIPTRWGSPAHRDQVFDYDATVITRLQNAGAVLVAKLAMVELAGGGGYEFASASLHGPGLNPWNVNHWSGGSSSGSGSVVAAGLVPFALGSETWGSINTPAAYCGVTGLRPTWGLVSRAGAMELGWTLDKIGPMARSAEDCGWILQAIAGPDANDPTTGRAFQFQPRLARRNFRVGVLPADFSDIPELGKAFDDALRVFRKIGVKLSRVELPDYPYSDIALTILHAETLATHEEFIKSDKLDLLVDASQKQSLRQSLQLAPGEYARALKQRAQITRDVLALFDQFDALVSPAVTEEAIPLEMSLKTRVRRRGNYSVLGALCGVPALIAPMGFGKQNLPLALALTGNRFGENALLQLGMRFQRETDWHRRHPAVPA